MVEFIIEFIFRFYRNLHLKAWYKQNISTTTDASVSGQAVSVPSKSPFKPKSTFCPIVQNATLNTFGSTVVWSKDKYVTEAYRQLDNDEFYQSFTFNPTDPNSATPATVSTLVKNMCFKTCFQNASSCPSLL